MTENIRELIKNIEDKMGYAVIGTKEFCDSTFLYLKKVENQKNEGK